MEMNVRREKMIIKETKQNPLDNNNIRMDAICNRYYMQ